jgi:hypothetical protein
MIKSILKLWFCISTIMNKSISKIWLQSVPKYMILFTNTVLKEKWIWSLNSAHDYSYERGSYSFKVKFTVIAEPTELQKTFMCSNNCLTLRHYDVVFCLPKYINNK